ncbi:MAG: helix-turn-helix transcriptional regulator [Lachnospiraceae bacterium]|nr:helix-turn-helix transcriptional regulator [Lachnospiraceae bacterium]
MKSENKDGQPLNTIEICRQFYIATGIPTVLFHGKELRYSSIGDYLEFLPAESFTLTETERNPEFCSTIPDIPFGRVFVEGTEDQVVIGPVFSFSVDQQLITSYMKEYGIPEEYREQITEYMTGLPVLTYIQFANYLLLLYTVLNGKSIGTEEFLKQEDQVQKGKEETGGIGPGQRPAYADPGGTGAYTAATKEDPSDPEVLFRQRNRREELFRLVRLGNERALSEYLARHPRLFDSPKMSGSPLRQAKDELISLLTEVSEACLVPTGVPLQRIREMQSVYIQKCEQLQSVEIVHWLRHGMLLDFCRQSGRANLPDDVSIELLQCLQYIRENLGSPLRIEDIAGAVGRSESYLTKLFRRELDMSPGDYMRLARIDAAKELLRAGNMPLSRIAYTLGYSSQAHFSSAFRKSTGMTPGEWKRN